MNEEYTQTEKFIRVNHEYYSPAEIARELQIGEDKVMYAYRKLGITPMTKGNILLKNIKEHPHATIQQLSAIYGYKVSYIRGIIRVNNLPNKSTARKGRPIRQIK